MNMNARLSDIEAELNLNGTVSIRGFGRFDLVDVPARNRRNPRTGEISLVPAHKALRFRAARSKRERVRFGDSPS